ncbi:TRAP transporter small permease [Marinomonas mediterranea]|uniref:TRAP transporter small permease protein n=2 Tax=Marinomonas mediterranea TaxID=119864 RepID=F2JVD8_MARM1|nr:TRAP transporter small permease [Marinomonas mediterranea]ADZ89396.1 Tripartite ATP-independent periplasmic transporter DctQ component [Marinomonas mediterranea MMB-1]
MGVEAYVFYVGERKKQSGREGAGKKKHINNAGIPLPSKTTNQVNYMNEFKNTCYQLTGWLSGLCIVAITLLLLAQIIGRLFGFIVPSAEDFAGFALAAATFFGLAYTFNEGGHIRVTLLIQRFSEKGRKWQEAIVLAMGFALTTYLTYACSYMVYESYVYEEVSYGYVPVPLWIPQIPVAFGALALNLAVLDSLIKALKGEAPNYVGHEDELAMEE